MNKTENCLKQMTKYGARGCELYSLIIMNSQILENATICDKQGVGANEIMIFDLFLIYKNNKIITIIKKKNQ